MRRTALLTAVLLALAAVFAAPAQAHDRLLGTTPADGATVPAAPSSVRLAFEEPPAAGYTRVGVHDASGRQLVRGVVTTGATIVATLDAGRRGRYVVSYSILSDDGHPVSGIIRFTVAPGTTASPTVRDRARPNSLSLGWVALIAAVLLAVAAGRAVSRAAARRVHSRSVRATTESER